MDWFRAITKPLGHGRVYPNSVSTWEFRFCDRSILNAERERKFSRIFRRNNIRRFFLSVFVRFCSKIFSSDFVSRPVWTTNRAENLDSNKKFSSSNSNRSAKKFVRPSSNRIESIWKQTEKPTIECQSCARTHFSFNASRFIDDFPWIEWQWAVVTSSNSPKMICWSIEKTFSSECLCRFVPRKRTTRRFFILISDRSISPSETIESNNKRQKLTIPSYSHWLIEKDKSILLSFDRLIWSRSF